MKKKAKKKMLNTLAVAAFILQAAEFGIELWDKWKTSPKPQKQPAKSNAQ